MFPQKSRSNATKNDFDVGVDFLGYLSDLYATPAIRI